MRLQVRNLARSRWSHYERVLGLGRLAESRMAPSGLGGGRGGGAAGLAARAAGRRPVPPAAGSGSITSRLLLPDRAALGRFVRHLGGLGEYAGSADHAVSERST